MRRLILGLVGLIVVVAVVVVGAAVLLDWGFLKSRIIEAAREATGREVAIDGDLSITLLPELRVRATDVRVANAPNADPADMVRFDSLSLTLDTLPLASKKVILRTLVLRNPSIDLQVDAQGRPNWDFAGKSEPDGGAPDRPRQDAGPAERGAPPEIEIHDVRIEGGRLRYADALSGQTVLAEDIMVTVAMPSMADPLSVNGAMILNDKPVTLQLSVDEPGQAAIGEQFALLASVASEPLNVRVQGTVQQQPIPGVDGGLELKVPSVGALAAWLGRPLAADQPDPGPLDVVATLSADGSRTVIEQAAIEGQSIALRMSGEANADGDKRSVTLSIDGGMIDLDPYLPPPAAAAETTTQAPSPGGDRRDRGGRAPEGGPSDTPFDLAPLRSIDADIQVAVEGIKARDFRSGPIDLGVVLRGGLLNAQLRQFALLDGNVTGALSADGGTDTLSIDATVNADSINTSGFAANAEAPLTGIVSAAVTAQGSGESPRALLESLAAHVEVALADIAGQGAVAQLQEAALTLDVRGMDAGPSGAGHVVYNGERIDLQFVLGTLRELYADQRTVADLSIDSRLFEASYKGALQMQPLPGLDGDFSAGIPSVGELARWAGNPLPDTQPDPGAVSLTASLGAEGETVTIDSAQLTGEALDASLSGRASKPASGPAQFELNANLARLDLDRYLPPPAEKADGGGAPLPAPGGTETADAPPAQGWPEDPIDMSGLHAANGTVAVTLGEVIYRGLDIRSGRLDLTLDNGVATAALADLQLSEGTIAGGATIDASSDVPRIQYEANVAGVAAKPLLSAFSGINWLSGTAQLNAAGQTAGGSVKALVEGLNGDGSFSFLDGAIEGFNLAAVLRNVGQLGLGGSDETQKTDFSELSGSMVITNGVVDNRDFKMLAPLVRVSGAGVVPMPPQTVDYTATATLVASLEGQGGDAGLAGLPIPVRVTGPWSAPNTEIDWGSVLSEAAKDPERLKQLPGELLGAAGDLGVELPPGILDGGVEGVIESAPEVLQQLLPQGEAGGGTDPLLEGLQQLIDPGQIQEAAPPADGAADAPASPAEPEPINPLDALQNLLER